MTTASSPRVSAAQGVVLAMVPVMVVLSVVVPLPVIPAMVKAFGNEGEASLGISLAITMPTLAIAFAGLLVGTVGDRISRRTMLVAGTAAFSVLAPLPLWIDSLWLLIASRFLTGLALGAMMVAAVGLVGDYFTGARRAFWLSAQGSFPAAATIVGAILSGSLGQYGWRTPFLMLLAGLPLLVVMLLLRPPAIVATREENPQEASRPDAAIDWARLAWIFLLTVVASLLMFAPAYEFGYILVERQVPSTLLTGGMTAVLGAGGVLGALALPALQRIAPANQLSLCFLVCGLGQLGVSVSTGMAGWMAGAAITGLAQGATVPVLSMWLLNQAGDKARGRAVSLFQTILYISQFSTPHLARFVALSTGGAGKGMLIYALVSGALAVALFLGALARRSKAISA